MKIKSKNIEFLIVLNVILLSKTMFWGIVYRRLTNIVLVILLVIIIILKRKKITMKTYTTFFLLSLVLLMKLLVTYPKRTLGYVASPLSLIIIFFEMAIIVTYIDKSEYIKNYVNIITIISIISLICFGIYMFNPKLINKLSYEIQAWDTVFVISPFYTWGKKVSLYQRNAGPFWEPGAYQAFIMIGMIMIICYKDKIKNSKLKFIILLVTLLTTQSTAGYILLGLLVVTFWGDILEVFTYERDKVLSQKSILILPLVCVVIFFIIFYIINSDKIINKFDENNASFSIRSGDICKSLQLISEKPFFGYGSGEERLLRENSIGIKHNSVGLLSLIYTYGMIFFAIYIYKYKRGLDSIFPFNSIIKRICVYIIFIVLHMTQGLYFLPMFSIFLYEWPNNMKVYTKKNTNNS